MPYGDVDAALCTPTYRLSALHTFQKYHTAFQKKYNYHIEARIYHMLSARLSNSMLAASMSPRTALVHAETLAKRPSADDPEKLKEHLYVEAKMCLQRGDVHTARTLFDLCPPDYIHVAAYKAQCALFLDLCARGVVHRGPTVDLRAELSVVLPQIDGLVAGQYAERLEARGFAPSHMHELEHYEDIVRTAGMADGFAATLLEHMMATAPTWAKVARVFRRAAAHCALDKCLNAYVRAHAAVARVDDNEGGDVKTTPSRAVSTSSLRDGWEGS